MDDLWLRIGVCALLILMFLAGLGLMWWERTALRREWEAEQRAAKLLYENLTTEQYMQLTYCGYLKVPSRSIPVTTIEFPRAESR